MISCKQLLKITSFGYSEITMESKDTCSARVF